MTCPDKEHQEQLARAFRCLQFDPQTQSDESEMTCRMDSDGVSELYLYHFVPLTIPLTDQGGETAGATMGISGCPGMGTWSGPETREARGVAKQLVLEVLLASTRTSFRTWRPSCSFASFASFAWISHHIFKVSHKTFGDSSAIRKGVQQSLL